jgi:hypothetical protein
MTGVVSAAKTTRSVAQWSGLARAAALVGAAGVCYAAAYGVGSLINDDGGAPAASSSPTARAAAAPAARVSLAPAVALPGPAVVAKRRVVVVPVVHRATPVKVRAVVAAPRRAVRVVAVRTVPVSTPVRSTPVPAARAAPKHTQPAAQPAARPQTTTFFDDGA